MVQVSERCDNDRMFLSSVTREQAIDMGKH